MSAAPTPAPTRWHQAPDVELSGPAQALTGVHDALEDRLRNLERLLASGVADDRLSFCDSTSAKIDDTKAKHAYVDRDPHAWAMGEVDSELEWLCTDWTPEKKKYIPSHLEAIKQVLATYEERITCHPGDVACNRGHVVGKKPNCACACESGWVGEACHERAVATVSTGRNATRAANHAPLAVTGSTEKSSPSRNASAGAGRSASFLSQTTARSSLSYMIMPPSLD